MTSSIHLRSCHLLSLSIVQEQCSGELNTVIKPEQFLMATRRSRNHCVFMKFKGIKRTLGRFQLKKEKKSGSTVWKEKQNRLNMMSVPKVISRTIKTHFLLSMCHLTPFALVFSTKARLH